MGSLKITGLYIYPVKSMHGITLKQAQLTPKGLLNDRLWMVVRANGRFVTQRDIPRLSMVNTELGEKGLVLSMQGHGSTRVPFDLYNGEQMETRVWRDNCQVIDQGEDISDWLTQALECKDPLRLVRMKPEYTRPQSHAALMGEETTTDFADAAPFLVANEASLERLNSVLESNSLRPVPMNRFRPNIVIRGLEPFAEHKLASLSTQGYQLKLCYPCKRCIVTTIDQDTGKKHPHNQPYKTLQSINPMPGNKKGPAFAENAILNRGNQQTIAVGDRIDAIFK